MGDRLYTEPTRKMRDARRGQTGFGLALQQLAGAFTPNRTPIALEPSRVWRRKRRQTHTPTATHVTSTEYSTSVDAPPRPSWDEYFIALVDATARRATCSRGRSGAVFTRDNDVLATGYVGAPPGEDHCDDVGHHWDETGKHCVRTVHAEQNAILRAARNGVSLRDSTLYCTMEPCVRCAASVVSLGVTRVVAKHAYHASGSSRVMLANADVDLITQSEELLYDRSR